MNETDAKFREQVVSLLPRLRRFARTLARHPHDADDLVQIAVERALLRREQWRVGSSVLNWMLGIVRNAWIDEIRSRKRSNTVLIPVGAVEDVGDSPMERDVELWTLQSALDRLPDGQRLAIGLVLVEGLSYKEAAEVMGVPIGTLTSRLARGRVALESMLAETVAPAAAPEVSR